MAPLETKSVRFGRPGQTERKTEKDRPSPLRIVKQHNNYSRPLAKRWSSTDEEGSPPQDHADNRPLRVMKKRASTIFFQDVPRNETGLSSWGASLSCNASVPWNGSGQDNGTAKGSTTSHGSVSKQGSSRPGRFSRIPKPRKVSILMREFFEAGEDGKTSSRAERNYRRGTATHQSCESPEYSSASDMNEQSVYSCPELYFSSPSSTASPVLTRAPAAYSWVLVPKITVTSNSTCLYDGQQSLWAAVEISGHASHASKGLAGTEGQQGKSRLFHEAGHLHNLTVEIRPTEGTTIYQIIRRQEFPAAVYLGSTILLVVRVGINIGQLPSPKRHGHVRQRSDELFADLDMQLGNSLVDYMEVHLSYSHSAFQDHAGPHAGAGISEMSSKMHTKAVATLQRHNAQSPWSRRPASATHKLFQLMEQHWGVERASEAIQRISSSYSTCSKASSESADPEKHSSDGSLTEVGSNESGLEMSEQAGILEDAPSRTSLASPVGFPRGDRQASPNSSMTTLQPTPSRRASADVESKVDETNKRAFSRSSKRGEEKGSSLWKRWSSYLP